MPVIMNFARLGGWTLAVIASGLWLMVIAVISSDRGATGAALLSGWIMVVAVPVTVLAIVILSRTWPVNRCRDDRER
jgi:hypothetical protein